MSKIFTPNILITRDYSLIQKLMSVDSYKLNISDLPSDSSTLVISSRQNRYVFELEHSINYGQTQSGVTLKFLDTDGKFEDSFLSEPFIQTILNDAIKRFINNRFDFSEINNYLSAKLNDGLKIYVMYGIGDDLRDWSDPIICSLVNCEIDAAATIRSYTYTFIPDANWFFQSLPAQDKRNPNYSSDLNFGAQNFRTSVELPIGRETRSKSSDPYASLSKFSANIRRLIKLYISKSTSIPEGNIVVVLPKFNESCVSYSQSEEWYGEKLKSILDDEFSGLEKAIKSSLSKSGGFGETWLGVSDWLRDNLVFSESLQLDYNPIAKLNPIYGAEIGRRSRVEQELAKSRAEGLQTLNSYRRFYKNIFNIDVCQYLTDQLKTKINQKVSGQLNVVDLETENLAKAVIEDTASKLSLIMSAESKSTKQANEEGQPQIPNFWTPINNIELGIKTVTNKPMTLMGFQESNAKMLRLFKKYFLIESDTKPCIVVGDTQMIRDYLYCNQTTAEQILKYRSNYEFEVDDPVRFSVAERNLENYRTDLIKIKFRNKGNSSFNERLKTDEFSIDKLKNDFIEESSKLGAQTDIPTFTLNFKNSNVISFSVNSGLNYMHAVQAAIADNRTSNLLDPIIENKDSLLANIGINQQQADEITKAIEDVFSRVEKTHDYKSQGAAASLDKVVSREAFDYIEEVSVFGKATSYQGRSLGLSYNDYALGRFGSAGDIPTVTKINKMGWQVANKNEDDAMALSVYLGIAQQYAGGIGNKIDFDITSQSFENTTYLALSYQLALKKVNPNLSGARLKNAADLLVLINKYNLSKGKNSGGSTLTVGVGSPKQNTIQSKILDYMLKNSFKLSLKTLPFFHLSDYFVIGRPSFFYSRKTSIFGTEPKQNLDFFSGQYFIGGFKHVISINDCYSEFTLQKAITSDDAKGVPS